MTMAQTGSAQREPSMEEILASIRRIIEDSDAVRTPAEEELQHDIEGVTTPADEAPSSFGEVEAFRASLDEPLQFEAADSAPQPAQVGEILPLRNEAPPAPAPMSEQPRQESEPSDFADDGDSQLATDDVAAATLSDARPAIISDQTGRQVAASFGELSEAFAARSRRSFDDMAQEMLRPMLQEWLDNNLPTLVERLVREEIERVARGG